MSDSFKIKITDYVEHEDGSATMHLDMCTEAQAMLIEAGLISLLKKLMDETEEPSD